jgi:hypothetical protein
MNITFFTVTLAQRNKDIHFCLNKAGEGCCGVRLDIFSAYFPELYQRTTLSKVKYLVPVCVKLPLNRVIIVQGESPCHSSWLTTNLPKPGGPPMKVTLFTYQNIPRKSNYL